jgi:hypothetical protein
MEVHWRFGVLLYIPFRCTCPLAYEQMLICYWRPLQTSGVPSISSRDLLDFAQRVGVVLVATRKEMSTRRQYLVRKAYGHMVDKQRFERADFPGALGRGFYWWLQQEPVCGALPLVATRRSASCMYEDEQSGRRPLVNITRKDWGKDMIGGYSRLLRRGNA